MPSIGVFSEFYRLHYWTSGEQQGQVDSVLCPSVPLCCQLAGPAGPHWAQLQLGLHVLNNGQYRLPWQLLHFVL